LSLNDSATVSNTAQEKLKQDVAAITFQRDTLQKQLDAATATVKSLQAEVAQLRGQGDTAASKQKASDVEVARLRGELELAKKAQLDSEQSGVRLKAAEDAVMASRAKSAEAERAAATAADAATKAKQQVSDLLAEKASMQLKIESLNAELARKAAVIDDAIAAAAAAKGKK